MTFSAMLFRPNRSLFKNRLAKAPYLPVGAFAAFPPAYGLKTFLWVPNELCGIVRQLVCRFLK